jgi:hypothetical protein
MRHLLKRMLRDHGLKCVRVSGVGPGPEVHGEDVSPELVGE